MGKPVQKKRTDAYNMLSKEFYANLTIFIYKKKEIARSRVKGVEIEFDSMKLASILDVPGHTAQQKVTEAAGVDPSGPSGHLPETVMNKLQAEFERARADRIQADLEKA
ncbi:hypothetical protein Dimus_030176 [Dionaea muscipula]